MLTLYYTPKACSLAPHVLLEESGLPYRAELVDIFSDVHKRPEYLAINPRARVPALRLESGEVLTEVISLLTWIAGQVPERKFIPSEPLERARCYELMSFIASRVHPSFAQAVRPDRFTPDVSHYERVMDLGVRTFAESLELLDGLLRPGPYAMGARYTVVDPYILVFSNCARYLGLDLGKFPRLQACVSATLARPAVQRTLAAEGLLPEAKAEAAG